MKTGSWIFLLMPSLFTYALLLPANKFQTQLQWENYSYLVVHQCLLQQIYHWLYSLSTNDKSSMPFFCCIINNPTLPSFFHSVSAGVCTDILVPLHLTHTVHIVPNMLLEKSGEIALKGTKRLSQSKKNMQLWMWLVTEVKADAVKNNIA